MTQKRHQQQQPIWHNKENVDILNKKKEFPPPFPTAHHTYAFYYLRLDLRSIYSRLILLIKNGGKCYVIYEIITGVC